MKQIALTKAFYNGSRVRPGQEVEVPEGYKAAWCAPRAEAEKIAAEAKAAKKAAAPKVDKSAEAAKAQAAARGPQAVSSIADLG